jgi:hypothetical protein
VLADQTAAPQCGDEGDAGHHRGQDERDQHERAHDPATAEVDAGQEPREGRPEDDAPDDGQQAAEGGDAQRLAHDLRAEVLGKGAPRGVEDQRRQGNHQQGDTDRGGHEQDRGRPAQAGPGHRPSPKTRGGSKPASRRTACPSGLPTSSTNSDARADPPSVLIS